jgi:hypothetical protein
VYPNEIGEGIGEGHVLALKFMFANSWITWGNDYHIQVIFAFFRISLISVWVSGGSELIIVNKVLFFFWRCFIASFYREIIKYSENCYQVHLLGVQVCNLAGQIVRFCA